MGRRAIALTTERRYWRAGFPYVAGVDEVGCGSLAGPVVAAAVILPIEGRIKGVVDSKLLKPGDREELAEAIYDRALAIALGAASVREVERLNIYHASGLAMRRAVSRLSTAPHCVLIDGRPQPCLGDHRSIIKGDRKCHSIACASIVAKVLRDHLMKLLGARYPQYGWEHNAGYATAEHKRALHQVGITPHHRRTFLTVQYALDLEFESEPQPQVEPLHVK